MFDAFLKDWPFLLLLVAASLAIGIVRAWFRRSLGQRMDGDPNAMDPRGPEDALSWSDDPTRRR